MVIIGIDIETTGGKHEICEFAAVALEAKTGKEIFKIASLIDPGHVEWNHFAMRVHGISPSMVRGKPGLFEVWNNFKTALSKYTPTARCFAHSAPFECTHLGNGLGRQFNISLECTIALAKPRIALSSYKLPLVCAALGIPFRETHRAEPDARAAALVAQRLLGGQVSSAPQKPPATGASVVSVVRRPPAASLAGLNAVRGVNSEILASTKQVGRSLAGKHVCITGSFPNGMTKEQAKRRVAAHGGIPVDSVTVATDLVVLAASGERVSPNDLSTAKAKKAVERRIELMLGPVFLRLTN